ncbi:hypothetical protein MUDCAT_35 [Arthrobacter phage Mudcat]|uniref:Uncharacterized protein n=2 Tax=Mudcatvirus TaxID=1982088 RepID=A0A222Z8B7_9CAUD|nr:hypothetical protein BI184_gp35 [Arthrobacter phage Mudcat]YP_010666515.1 hypothetical protein PQB79_gp036 [Arthrobacter phage Heisenberger]AMM44403.1 hypothetical protein MUDCAT_35 [Arthrobacter phage Mudcat]ASR80290.1 hypothetical protein SEA_HEISENBERGER_36 [Arthrobacter phage Heisenberger]
MSVFSEDFKKKYTEARDKAVTFAKEHPLETVVIISMAITAGSKGLNSITQARNAKTWQREVDRRERNQRDRFGR